MRHLQITTFIIRLIGLALIVHLLREHFDVGLYGDDRMDPRFANEPSFRFVGIYLLHASHTFWIIVATLELCGSLLLCLFPQRFARLLWSGIALGGVDHSKPQP